MADSHRSGDAPQSPHSTESWAVYRLANDPVTYGDDAGKCIITTADGETEICGVVYREEDARLIAAAPELFAVCYALLRAPSIGGGPGSTTLKVQSRYLEDARAAYLKVKGGDA